jgi:hypothetical protein
MWYYPLPIGEPCEEPTIQEFRARFPEFANVSDATVQIAIDDASCWADTSWLAYCRNCTTAIAFLAAHYLALQLYQAQFVPDIIPAGEDGAGMILPGGDVSSLSFEGMSVSFTGPKVASMGGSGLSGSGIGENMDLGSTYYGQRYLELLKVNQPAVVIV